MWSLLRSILLWNCECSEYWYGLWILVRIYDWEHHALMSCLRTGWMAKPWGLEEFKKENRIGCCSNAYEIIVFIFKCGMLM